MQKILAFANTQAGLYLIAGCLAVVSSVATWALKKLGTWAHVAAATAQAQGNEHLQTIVLNAAELLSQCAADAVSQVEANIRPTILGAAANGKLTDDQGKTLKAQAVSIAWQHAQATFGRALEIAGVPSGGPVPQALEQLVEAAVQRLASNSRAQGTAPQPPPAAPTQPGSPAQGSAALASASGA